MSTSLFYFQGQPVTAEEFIKKLFNTITLPNILKSEEELRELWRSPITRSELLKKLKENGFTLSDLRSIQSLIEAEDSDIYDVLEYIAYTKKPISRTQRVEQSEDLMQDNVNPKHKEFIDFVLSKYVESGIEELDLDRLSELLTIKYKSIHDAQVQMGNAEDIKESFIKFQKYLY